MFISCEMFSASLATYVGLNLVIPDGKAPEYGWPNLLLLHGFSDDETVWMRRSSVERYADRKKVAVIMPAVHKSGYTDMSHGGLFYTYVTKELPMVLRDYFNLSARREDRAVAGLSMGGEGALKIGLACPEEYSAIGCFSAGAFNSTWDPDPDFGEKPNQFMRHTGKILDGLPEDVFENAKRIIKEGRPMPRIYHATGSSDPMIPQAHETRDFFMSLEGNPFGYVYCEDEGAHTWEYWDAHLPVFLDFWLENKV